jgi:hypothetical protein
MNIVAGSKVVFVGDSITAQGWFNGGTEPAVTGTLEALINANGLGTVVPGVTSGTPGSVTGVGGVSRGQSVPFVTVNSGVSGNAAANIATDLANRVTNFNPNVVFLEVGINDAVVYFTDPTAFAASYSSILSGILAWNPATKIICVGLIARGEQWSTGPTWGINIYDSNILQFDGIIQTIVVGAGANVIYADIRTPLLAYEAAHNTPAPGVLFPVVTVDGIHPIISSGQILVSGWVNQNITVVPS